MARALLDNIERLPSPVLTQIMGGMRRAINAERADLAHREMASWSRGFARKNIREWEAIWEKCREVILKRDKNYVDGQEVLDVW